MHQPARMKKLMMMVTIVLNATIVSAQQDAKVKEYNQVFRTYPFSDPDPIPEMSKIYPYFRYDGYTNNAVNKEWKVVELENDYIKVLILPQIGGKIWAAIDKSNNKSFIYHNQVVKFRDVAMRGPWTSGGLEPNYGIVGHTPNCATPVDYTIIKKKDGSVSCVVGVLDLLTRSVWRIDVNLPKNKAYFTTSSTWYNASPFEQPYYHWMNGALRAADDLQFFFPGNKYIGHGGEYSSWPIDDKGRDLSRYRNNDFGSYKSYHVFGKHSNFWGAYYHDEDFGMARYAGYDDKPGKKIWIWGLSREGMIWEKLLTDNDGQYVEVQSGRLFNQPAEGSSFTPFKNRGFTAETTDQWKEYWFPVKQTRGMVAASEYGSLNVVKRNGYFVIYISPAQQINEELTITVAGRQVYNKKIQLKTLKLFTDSIAAEGEIIQVQLGDGKLMYDGAPDAGKLSRPFVSPAKFDWNSVQGLHLQGKEFIRQRMYPQAEEKLQAALKEDSNYLPALGDYAMLMYRQMKYEEGLRSAKRGLAIDAYDPASNYYYGLINEKLGMITDAKDGYDVASQSVEYRSAAYLRRAILAFRNESTAGAELYARRSLQSNRADLNAYQILAMVKRIQNRKEEAITILDSIASIDPLSHFVNFERHLLDKDKVSSEKFLSMIRNEMPEQTFLELASWYYQMGRNEDALAVLKMAKVNTEIAYWKGFLEGSSLDLPLPKAGEAFPFRHESAEIIKELLKKHHHWLLKYHLALMEWNNNNLTESRKLMEECGDEANYAPFYAARARIYPSSDSVKILEDLKKAKQSGPAEWRYSRALVNYYSAHHMPQEARKEAEAGYRKHPSNYILGMLYAKALTDVKDYTTANKLLSTLNVLPNEGATGGRMLFRDTKLQLAAENIRLKKYKNALEFISASKEWPERLGSGKPYQEDIDERLEDWMTYIVYQRQGNKTAADQTIKRITEYSNHAALRIKPSLNDYISAKAIKISGEPAKAVEFLKKKAELFPGNAVLEWAASTLQEKGEMVPNDIIESDSFKLLTSINAME